MTYTYIGVDLSKDWLDVVHPIKGHSRVANTDRSIRAWLGQLEPQAFVVFEATSLCDQRLMRHASALGQAYFRLNPLHAWHFGQSLNLPKTDRVDAAMLARLGMERALTPAPAYAAHRAELAELNARRDQLKRMQTQEKNRLSKTVFPGVRSDIREVLRVLGRHVDKIEAQINEFIAQHPDLRTKLALLESIPGIGRVASVTLLSTMPELGQADRRAVASLGGVAPKARESGKWRGRRTIGAGRRHVRRVLYMAGLSVLSHGTLATSLVRRLRDKGKAGKVIIIALARKILTLANAVLRDQTPFKIQCN